MRITPLITLSLVMLAACGSKDDASNASNTSTAAESGKTGQVEANKPAIAAAIQAFNPGQWRTTTELVALDMPGMPKELADQMGKSMMKATSTEHCMTPEEAKKPSDALARDNGNCSYDKFTMEGGKLEAVMRCKSPDNKGTMEMALTGDYSPERYAFQADMKVSQPQLPGKEMTMKIKATSERIGECKPA